MIVVVPHHGSRARDTEVYQSKSACSEYGSVGSGLFSWHYVLALQDSADRSEVHHYRELLSRFVWATARQELTPFPLCRENRPDPVPLVENQYGVPGVSLTSGNVVFLIFPLHTTFQSEINIIRKLHFLFNFILT